jgi:membrane protein
LAAAAFAWRVACGAGVRFHRGDGFVLAGYLAYLAILSLIPFLIFLVALIGLVGASEAGRLIVGFVLDSLPPEAAGTLAEPIVQIFREPRGDLLTVGMIGTLWAAATGVEGLRNALNRVAEGQAPKRPVWRRRLQAILIVLGFGTAFLVVAVAIVATPAVVPAFADWFDVPRAKLSAWGVGRYLAGAAVLSPLSAALYHILPDQRPPLRTCVPGAIVVVAMFLAGGALFSLYVTHAANFAAVYGGLGGLVATLTFFYLIGAIFILGGCINAEARAQAAAARERAR